MIVMPTFWEMVKWKFFGIGADRSPAHDTIADEYASLRLDNQLLASHLAGTLVQRDDLAALLKEAYALMSEYVNDNEGHDRYFDLACGNCDAGVPMKHSFGCRIEQALRKAGRK